MKYADKVNGKGSYTAAKEELFDVIDRANNELKTAQDKSNIALLLKAKTEAVKTLNSIGAVR